MKEFVPHKRLRNPHLMTIAATFWRRKFPRLPKSDARFFELEQGTQVRGECHWQVNRKTHPTLVLLHGLEGSSESAYMFGTAEKAFVSGFNVIRLNQRNCGGTEKLTPTLYHSGLSGDMGGVLLGLIKDDGLSEIFAAGFSMGGNLVLKMAGEFGDVVPRELRAIVAIAPALDLAACADALAQPRNFLYNRHFVKSLKKHMRYKSSLYPGLFPLEFAAFRRIRTVRDFDDVVTARFCGFQDAADYYKRSSASKLLSAIRCQTLILTAQDDPFVPFGPFQNSAIQENPHITLIAPPHGGHCAFISEERGADRFWAEARIVEFCLDQSSMKEVRKRSTVDAG
ncbi:MAG TPA: alpha/beta fold hydrolase [Candidatus Binatus sp.]|nr:alpha/beta fold hydrolase [Candidatus Binatus sp.]